MNLAAKELERVAGEILERKRKEGVVNHHFRASEEGADERPGKRWSREAPHRKEGPPQG